MKKLLLSVLAVLMTAGLFSQPYYVAGNGHEDANGVFAGGVLWEPRGSEMINTVGNIWSITYQNVAAGTYQFKITNDGDWDTGANWTNYAGEMVSGIQQGAGGTNIQFTIPIASDITITFDAANNKITALESSNGFGELVITVYSLLGDLIGDPTFEPAVAVEDMTEQNGIWKITVAGIAPGTYGYKVVGNRAYAAYEYPGIDQKNYIDVTIDNAYVTVTFDPNQPDNGPEGEYPNPNKLFATESADPPSKLGDNFSDSFELYGNKGTIYCSAKNFIIYNMLGVDVTAENGRLSGIYLVKAGEITRSIFVGK